MGNNCHNTAVRVGHHHNFWWLPIVSSPQAPSTTSHTSARIVCFQDGSGPQINKMDKSLVLFWTTPPIARN